MMATSVQGGVDLDSTVANGFANKVGKLDLVLYNVSDETRNFTVHVLNKNMSKIDPSLWRTDLSEVKDNDVATLAPDEQLKFQLQLKEQGKYYVCSFRQSTIGVRQCIRVIYKKQ